MSSSKPVSLTLPAARRIALAAQGFGDPMPKGAVTARHLQRVYDRVSVLQIDAVNVLTRAHYLPVFARLGEYDRPALDRMEHPRRAVFEYWAHVASLSPVEHHPLLRWRMEAERVRSWQSLEAVARDRAAYVEDVRAMIAEQGPLTAAQVAPDRPGKIRGEMWSWHEGKVALERLFRVGELTSVRRNSQFERVYDLTDRVIPADILAVPTPSPADAKRALLEIAARSHGVATAGHLKDYFRLRGPEADQGIRDLVEDGVLVPAAVHGSTQRWFLHRDARRPRAVRRAALLSPFDSLVWERDRTRDLWGMHYRIEIYTPKAKRLHGYYVLPFLLDEQIVARADLKADRSGDVLRVQQVSAEEHATHPIGYVAERMAEQLVSMAQWLGLSGVTVQGSGSLAAAMRQQRLAV